MAFDEHFNEQCLEAHNLLRVTHDAPALRLNRYLAESAQHWAEELAASGRLQHSSASGDKIGESLAIRWSSGRSTFNGAQVTEQWYSEISQYKFGDENQLNCGNFSQLVWRSTTDAGFGKAVAPSGKIFVVGQYLPPGNIMNEWRENVLPPCESDDETESERRNGNGDEYDERQELPIHMEFNQQCLDSHNVYRERHDAKPLEFDIELARMAQEWADQLARMGSLKHSPASEGKVGENVGMKWSSRGGDITGQRATDQWYNECKNYNYEKENQLNCGHFSQVVWRSSRRAGFGKAYGTDGKLFVVGQYTPPGNYRNRWRENVRPPRDRPASLVDGIRSVFEGVGHRSDSPRDSRSSSLRSGRSAEAEEFGPEELAAFNEECLSAHNRLRRRHGAPDLAPSERLMESAQRWAEKLGETGALTHSAESGSKVGENVGMKWSSRGSNITGEQATDQWYKESKIYNYNKENQLNCGHFSQVVWRSSREVGFGKVRTANGKIFVVAHYHPPGNYRDRWRENVLPLQDEDDLSERSKLSEPSPVRSRDQSERLSPLRLGLNRDRATADSPAGSRDRSVSDRSTPTRVSPLPTPDDKRQSESERRPDSSDQTWPGGSLSSLSSGSPRPSPDRADRTDGPELTPTVVPEERPVEVQRTRAVRTAPARSPSPPPPPAEPKSEKMDWQWPERKQEEKEEEEEEEKERKKKKEEEKEKERLKKEKEEKEKERKKKEDEDEEWERPPEFQPRQKVRTTASSYRTQPPNSPLRARIHTGASSFDPATMNRDRSAMNGEAEERTVTRRRVPKLERSPSPTDPDDKYFSGPKGADDQMVSRKLMRRNTEANVIMLTTAEIYERPNQSRYVVIGAARELVSGKIVY